MKMWRFKEILDGDQFYSWFIHKISYNPNCKITKINEDCYSEILRVYDKNNKVILEYEDGYINNMPIDYYLEIDKYCLELYDLCQSIINSDEVIYIEN